MGQLTTLNTVGANITYNFPAASTTNGNNGRIVSQAINGETVAYQYDSLNRLASATGSGWAQTFAFDGFGNLMTQTGTGGAPNLNITFTGKNRQVGGAYDDNGNQLVSSCQGCDPYDVDNRLFVLANSALAGYDASNKRVFERRPAGAGSEDRVYFFGVSGQRLGEFKLKEVTSGSTVIGLRMEGIKQNYYFGGRLLRQNDEVIGYDRLGNVVGRKPIVGSAVTTKYYPFGQEYTVTADDKEKFGTYWRDTQSGMDYADQRYYSYLNGRFASPDPYKESGGAGEPGSWNRYSYTRGDPANRYDPEGLQDGGPPHDPFAGLTALINGRLRMEYERYIGQLPAEDPKEALQQSLNQTTSSFRLNTAYALKDMNAGCKEKLGKKNDKGVSIIDQLTSNLATVKYLDANDQIQLSGTLEDMFGTSGYEPFKKTFAEFLDSSGISKAQGAYGDAFGLGHVIVLGPGFSRSDRSEQRVTLVHELLHSVFRDGHRSVADRLGIAFPNLDHLARPGFDPTGLAASAAIDDWIKSCYK